MHGPFIANASRWPADVQQRGSKPMGDGCRFPFPALSRSSSIFVLAFSVVHFLLLPLFFIRSHFSDLGPAKVRSESGTQDLLHVATGNTAEALRGLVGTQCSSIEVGQCFESFFIILAAVFEVDIDRFCD
jgi:hypothetical protein